MNAHIKTDDGQEHTIDDVEKAETDFATQEARIYVIRCVTPMKFEGVTHLWVTQ